MYKRQVYDSSSDELIWKTFYNHLKAANNVLKLIAADTEDSSLKVYQMCIRDRLYTEPTDIATEGKGRATVEEVYQQITSDLDKAITMLGLSLIHI